MHSMHLKSSKNLESYIRKSDFWRKQARRESGIKSSFHNEGIMTVIKEEAESEAASEK